MEGFWELVSGTNASQIKDMAANNLAFTLALCFVSGILTSFTPCVYPVIPITINIFGRYTGNTPKKGFDSATFRLAAIYVAGMCTTYMVLGLISGMTGSLFGSILQSSWVLGGLALLFFVLALGQFGLFEISLPSSLQTKLASSGSANSKTGIYLMGLFAGLIISPCVGPIVAGILAFVFESSNAILGAAYFLSFSLGLGVLFLVIGGFSGMISSFPRSGHWMTGINRVLASLLLVASGYYGVLYAKQVGIMERSIPTVGGPGVNWLDNEEEALALAKKKNLPVIIDFSAEWCTACHEIDALVFQNKTVVSEMQNKIIAVRIDVTENSETNSAVLRKYGVIGLPTIVFLDKKGNLLESPRISGLVTPETYLKMLEQVTSLTR